MKSLWKWKIKIWGLKRKFPETKLATWRRCGIRNTISFPLSFFNASTKIRSLYANGELIQFFICHSEPHEISTNWRKENDIGFDKTFSLKVGAVYKIWWETIKIKSWRNKVEIKLCNLRYGSYFELIHWHSVFQKFFFTSLKIMLWSIIKWW